MPTPAAVFVDAAQVLSDSYVFTGVVVDQLILFISVPIGLALAGWVFARAKRTASR